MQFRTPVSSGPIQELGFAKSASAFKEAPCPCFFALLINSVPFFSQLLIIWRLSLEQSGT
jgi:hypothetical protein